MAAAEEKTSTAQHGSPTREDPSPQIPATTFPQKNSDDRQPGAGEQQAKHLWSGLDWRDYGVWGIRLGGMALAGAELPGEVVFSSIREGDAEPMQGLLATDGKTLHTAFHREASVTDFGKEVITDTIGRYVLLCAVTTEQRLVSVLQKHLPDLSCQTMMVYIGEDKAFSSPMEEGRVVEPSTLEEVYSLLQASQPGFAEKCSYCDWLVDMSHRQRRGLACSRVYRLRGEALATASLIYRYGGGGILGDVATRPDARGRGYASFLVGHFSRELHRQGLRLFLHTTIPAFYRPLGWREWGALYVCQREGARADGGVLL